jgi:hypothetical protein
MRPDDTGGERPAAAPCAQYVPKFRSPASANAARWEAPARQRVIIRSSHGTRYSAWQSISVMEIRRRLRALVAELETLTLAIADVGQQAKPRPAAPARHTRQTNA